jgi:hypothetical protein
MSWQKIFNTARRFGTPVIVTDQAGTDPMVILPFDIYEGLISENGGPNSYSVKPKNKKSLDRMAEPDASVESILEIPYEDIENQKNGLTEPINDIKTIKKTNDLPDRAPDSLEGDISLEERFYFEPMEDEIKK